MGELGSACCSWWRLSRKILSSTMRISTVSTVVFTFLVASVAGDQRAAENRLMSSLLANYNSMFIPVLNSSVPIVVNMETMLKKIVEYDYERGILTSLVWLDFQWMDEYLKWNPADYEGITQIQLPPNKLWTPDIFLFNDVTGHFGEELMRGRPYLVIENNGDVRWIPPMVLKTVCEHDNQEESCDLKFGSWVYNAGQLDLRPNIDTMDLEDYTGSTPWDLSETRVFRRETMYDCCINPFVDITYTIRFHKKGKMSSMFKAKGWGL